MAPTQSVLPLRRRARGRALISSRLSDAWPQRQFEATIGFSRAPEHCHTLEQPELEFGFPEDAWSEASRGCAVVAEAGMEAAENATVQGELYASWRAWA